MKFPIVCGDIEREAKALRVLGGTADAVVLEVDGEPRACDRTTGAPVAVPGKFTPIAASGEITVDGVPLVVTKAAVMRAGVATEPRADGDQAVTLPGLGALRIDPNGGNHRLVPTLIPARGRLATLQNLVEWTTNDKPNSNFERDTSIPWTLSCEPTARVAIIATPRRASWITFEALQTLLDLPEPRDHFRSATVECVVARVPSFPKLDYFYLDRSVDRRDAPGDLVAKALTPMLRKRIAAVAELLLDLDVATAATLAVPYGRQLTEREPAIVVGTLFEDHAKTAERSDWIHGTHTAARAARANAELAATKDLARFVSFETLSYGEPTFVRVTPPQKTALAKLLELDPELPPLPPANNADELARAIAELAEIAAPVVWKNKRVEVHLTLEAASKIEDLVR